MKLSTFKGTLKQVLVSKLDSTSRALLDRCFPEFVGGHEVSAKFKAQGIQFVVTSKGMVPASSGRMRRYAGDEALPGGRYYSVCQDASGRDGGTLVWELMSYWSAGSGVFPAVIDSTVHVDAADVYRAHLSWLDKPFLLLKLNEIESVSAEGIVLGNGVSRVLPLEIHEVEIPGVLDLRTRAAQDWFTAHFGSLETRPDAARRPSASARLRTLKHPPADFRALLPTLLAQSPGGFAFHEAVGAWLRSHEVQGLVFPSARRDCRVSCTDEEVIDFDGWNFVDYRGAGAAPFEGLFGLQPHWLKPQDTGVEVREWEETTSARRWHITGVEEGERRRYSLEWRSLIEKLPPSVVWNTRDRGREK